MNTFNSSFRNLRRTHQPRIQIQSQSPLNQTIHIVDHKLQYLKKSFKNNVYLIETYVGLIKNKRKIKIKDINQLYNVFTANKADLIMFDYQISNKNEEFISNSSNMLLLKRSYARLIQKIIVKLSYFFMNKISLNFITKNVMLLARKCQITTRRMLEIKDFSLLNESIHMIYKQNQIIQQKILNQLINQNYISSTEQFYTINGIDQKAAKEIEEMLYRSKENDRNLQEQQQNQNQIGFSFNHTSKSFKSFKNMTKSKLQKTKNYLQLQTQVENTFKSIIGTLNTVFNQQKSCLKNKQSSYRQNLQQTKIENTQIGYEQANQDQIRVSINKYHENKQFQKGNFSSAKNVKINDNSQIRQENKQKYKQKVSLDQQNRETLFKKKLLQRIQQKEGQLVEERIQMHDKNNIYKSKQNKSQNLIKKPLVTNSDCFSKHFMTAITSIQKSNFSKKDDKLSLNIISNQILKYNKATKFIQIDSKIQQQQPTKTKFKKDSIFSLLKILRKNQQRQSSKKFQRIVNRQQEKMQNFNTENKQQSLDTLRNHESTNQRNSNILRKLNNPFYFKNLIKRNVSRQQSLQSKQININQQKFNQNGKVFEGIKKCGSFNIYNENDCQGKIQTQRFSQQNTLASSKINQSYTNKTPSYKNYQGHRNQQNIQDYLKTSKCRFNNQKIKEYINGVKTEFWSKNNISKLLIQRGNNKMKLLKERIHQNFIITNKGSEKMFRTIGNSAKKRIRPKQQNKKQLHSISSPKANFNFQVFDRIRRIKL